MTAKGKITAATAFTSLTHPQGAGPVRVLLVRERAEVLEAAGVKREPGLVPAARKTGVETLVLLEAETRLTISNGWSRRATRDYRFRTSQGWTLWMSPAQTLILAPEDAAAVKRAEKEARAEAEDRQKRVSLRSVSTEELEKSLTDCSPTLAAWIQEELEDRMEAARQEWSESVLSEVQELVEDGQTLELAQALVAEVPVMGVDEGPTDWVQRLRPDAVELAPGIVAAPIGSPRPSPEDLSDLALALEAEELEHVHPDEDRPEPADPPAVKMDVVTIHRGDRLYEVLQLDGMSALDGLARVAPCDPEDHRDPQWVSLDLLHVRPPLGSYRTEEITERVRQTREVFAIQGEDRLVVIRTILTDSRRLPEVTLATIPAVDQGRMTPVATLRAGEALLVDGRCMRVLDLEGDGTLTLEPATWRARLEPTGA